MSFHLPLNCSSSFFQALYQLLKSRKIVPNTHFQLQIYSVFGIRVQWLQDICGLQMQVINSELSHWEVRIASCVDREELRAKRGFGASSGWSSSSGHMHSSRKYHHPSVRKLQSSQHSQMEGENVVYGVLKLLPSFSTMSITTTAMDKPMVLTTCRKLTATLECRPQGQEGTLGRSIEVILQRVCRFQICTLSLKWQKPL